MSKPSQTIQSEDRLSIRANSSQKDKLRRAAEVRHTTMSQFVLESSLNAAEEVLRRESVLDVSAEEYDWLCKSLDAPARDLPELKKLLSEKPAWDV